MKTIELDRAVSSVAEYARDLRDEPVIFTRGGAPVAALVTLENTDLETASLSVNPQFLALIERSCSRLGAEGGISPEEMRQRLG